MVKYEIIILNLPTVSYGYLLHRGPKFINETLVFYWYCESCFKDTKFLVSYCVASKQATLKVGRSYFLLLTWIIVELGPVIKKNQVFTRANRVLS